MGYKFKDKIGASGGIVGLLAKGSTTAKSKLSVAGKGTGLDDPASLPLVAPVTTQVQNLDTGLCMGAVFDGEDAIQKSSAEIFKAKAAAP